MYKGHGYYFSWEDPKTSELYLSWVEGREFCRSRCMELVSLESKSENEYVNQRIAKGMLSLSYRYILNLPFFSLLGMLVL